MSPISSEALCGRMACTEGGVRPFLGKKTLHVVSVWNMWCFGNSRCVVLPCPGCCAPLQSPCRKSTHNSRTPLRAGNEVLGERQRRRVEVYFCTVTTVAHVEYFRDLYKAVYGWGWPRLPGREQAISPWILAGRRALYHSQKQPWQLRTYIRHAKAPWVSAGWQADKCISREK